MASNPIQAFIERERGVNALLEANGAIEAATARGRLLSDLEATLEAEAETLTVREVATMAGVAQETVRRAVRSGEIADTRTVKNGKMRIEAGAVDYLRGKSRKASGYDAGSHARRLLKLAS